MPYKSEYNRQTVGKGASRTPKNVMGGQGKSVSVKPMHHKTKKTSKTLFPGGM